MNKNTTIQEKFEDLILCTVNESKFYEMMTPLIKALSESIGDQDLQKRVFDALRSSLFDLARILYKKTGAEPVPFFDGDRQLFAEIIFDYYEEEVNFKALKTVTIH